MPPYKTPRSLESLSCDLVLGLLYHLTIRSDKFHQIWSDIRKRYVENILILFYLLILFTILLSGGTKLVRILWLM